MREGVAPGAEDFIRLLDGRRGQLLRGLVEAADDFGLLRGVRALQKVPGLDSLAADDERVLAPQLALDLRERLAHRARVLFFREVRERLVAELFVLQLLHTLLLALVTMNAVCWAEIFYMLSHAKTNPEQRRTPPRRERGHPARIERAARMRRSATSQR